MKIAIGSDHAGYPYKKPIIDYLNERGFQVVDFGTNSEEKADYPTYAFQVSEAIRDQQADLGILICGTGIGMSIAANKVKGVRAGACQTSFVAKAMREHNQANVLCLGSRTNTLKEVLAFVEIFVDTDYTNDKRHQNRIDLIRKYEGE